MPQHCVIQLMLSRLFFFLQLNSILKKAGDTIQGQFYNGEFHPPLARKILRYSLIWLTALKISKSWFFTSWVQISVTTLRRSGSKEARRNGFNLS